MSQILIIEDDEIMTNCLELAVKQAFAKLTESSQAKHEIHKFTNALTAISSFDQSLPDLIFLDVLLNGPDGFTFLNELISYTDTAKIPIVLVTSLNLKHLDLTHYGVIKVLQKETMLPTDVTETVLEVLYA